MKKQGKQEKHKSKLHIHKPLINGYLNIIRKNDIVISMEGIIMTIEEAIKESGTTNVLAKGSTKKTQSLIESNEEVLYAINANVIVKENKSANANAAISLKNTVKML